MKPPSPIGRRLRRWLDQLGTRPLLLLAFLLSAAALGWMQWHSQTTVSVHAIGWAAATEYSAPVEATVSQVHVQPGQFVQAGQPLLTLSSLPLRREVELLDAEIQRMERLALLESLRGQQERWRYDLEAARLRGDARRELIQVRSQETQARDRVQATQAWEARQAERAQRRLTSSELWEQAQRDLAWEQAQLKAARQQRSTNADILEQLQQTQPPQEQALRQSTQDYYEAELALLRQRRAHLAQLLSQLQLKARHSGRVLHVASVGSAATPSSSLVSLLPEKAPEVIAWLPPETNPASVSPGTPVTLASQHQRCASQGSVARVGASVQATPPQIPAPLLGLGATTGLPVYISVPGDCPLGVGQLLQARLQPPR